MQAYLEKYTKLLCLEIGEELRGVEEKYDYEPALFVSASKALTVRVCAIHVSCRVIGRVVSCRVCL